MRRRHLWFVAAALLSALTGCGSAPEAVPTFAVDYSLIPRATYAPLTPVPTVTPGGETTVSYTKNIQPIFNRYCISCHGGIADWWLTDYEHVMAPSANGPQVIPGEPEESALYDYVYQGLMPPFSDRLPPGQIELIRRWIAEGAVKN